MVMRSILAALVLLAATSARADYNRQVGVVALPDPAFTTGQVMRATGTDNAEVTGGADDRVMVGNGASWIDTAIPLCSLTANPPQFLWYNTANNTFSCLGATVLAQPAMQVLFGTGTGVTSSSHFKFDDATNSIMVGDVVTPGELEFPMNASTFGFGQVRGRAGGSYMRFYPNRNVAIAAETTFFGIDSQNDSDGSANTNGVFITSDNNDAGVGWLRYGWREDGRMVFYSPNNSGISISLQTPNLGLFDGQAYTLPTAKPAVDRYCLGSTIAGAWSWVDCALLGGRVGGQTLYGGTAASTNLVLGSNAANLRTGYIGTSSVLNLFPSGVAGLTTNDPLIDWTSTWSITSTTGFPYVLRANGALNYTAAPVFGLPPQMFSFGSTITYDAANTGMAGLATYYSGPTFSPATGRTPIFLGNSTSGLATFTDKPTFTRAGTGNYDATSGYVGFKSFFQISGGTMPDAVGFRVQDATGAGTLTSRRGYVVDNLTKCTPPACVGLSNASTTDYPGATQNLNASGAITGCQTRTSAYITQGSAGATLRINAAPTLANGNDGQTCRITNVDTAGNTAFSIEDETVTAGTNLRVSVAASCNLCALGTCTLNTRDFVEFAYNGVLGDWIMTGCANN